MKNPTKLTQQELSTIKHTLWKMVQLAGYWDETNYLALSKSLEDLNFKDNSLDSYAVRLGEIVNELIDIDDVNIGIEQLYQFQDKLKWTQLQKHINNDLVITAEKIKNIFLMFWFDLKMKVNIWNENIIQKIFEKSILKVPPNIF